MQYKLIIGKTLPNLNDYIASLNVNKYRGSQLKRESEYVISQYITKQLKGVHIKNKVFVSFKWFEPDKTRDKDNVAFAKKFIFDALVRCKILKNDGWSYVHGFSDDFDVDKNNPRIEVDIFELMD